MNVLIVGGGGREHAIAWKLSRSPRVTKIFCAPGNAGTALLGENLPVGASDVPALVQAARDHRIELTVVGPDDALAAGIVDAFQAEGLKIFGPVAAAAQLESSKAFGKDFMRRHGIPTAEAREFEDSLKAHAWCTSARYPLVIKADGLALGKGVVIATNPLEAAMAIHRSMDLGAFGVAGRRVIIEEFLEGRECSLHALVDGSGNCLFPDAKDHKRALDGDAGPNTGGMGTISPSGLLDAAAWEDVRMQIMDRFVAGLRSDGIPYRGMLFPGLMLTASGPKVLEFNCRFGDPETQVFVRRLETDLLDLLVACTEDRVAAETPVWDEAAACCVVLTSGGYPGKYPTGKEIAGIEAAEKIAGVEIFHAGTRQDSGRFVTAGGRVLGVTATGIDLNVARSTAYTAARLIGFDGVTMRSDIGAA